MLEIVLFGIVSPLLGAFLFWAGRKNGADRERYKIMKAYVDYETARKKAQP